MNLALTETKDLFDALGDRLRLRLACCLLTVKEGLCVCELVEALKVSQPNASRHLRLMKAAGLVNEERDGRWVYYRLKDAEHPFFKNIRCCIETVRQTAARVVADRCRKDNRIVFSTLEEASPHSALVAPA